MLKKGEINLENIDSLKPCFPDCENPDGIKFIFPDRKKIEYKGKDKRIAKLINCVWADAVAKCQEIHPFGIFTAKEIELLNK